MTMILGQGKFSEIELQIMKNCLNKGIESPTEIQTYLMIGGYLRAYSSVYVRVKKLKKQNPRIINYLIWKLVS